MERQFKLNSQQRQQEESQQTASTSQPVEFASVEQMLRHDALHTPVPPAIEGRLREALGSLAPARPWWKRWLGL